MQVWDKRQSVVSLLGASLVFLIAFIVLLELRAPYGFVVLPALFASLFYYLNMRRYFLRKRCAGEVFPPDWRQILEKNVGYYRRLSDPDKRRFEVDVNIFLRENRITAIDTEIDDRTRLLVASSAVILTFGRPDWEYKKLPEILIYPRSFDSDYSTVSHPKRRALAGIVVPQDGIVLAKNELLQAFTESSEAYHVGLHEFAHALDLADGRAEGIPNDLDPRIITEWVQLMKSELRRVRQDRSVLDPYAGKNMSELFAVAVEHFFQRPDELRAQHERLYRALEEFFHQDPAAR